MNPITMPRSDEFIPIRGSIRNRMLVFALGAITITILVTTLVAFDLTRTVIQQAQQTSGESLRMQAEAYLVQINDTIAGQNNLILDRAAKDIQAVAKAAESIYSGNLPLDHWSMEAHLFSGPEGQLMNGGEDVSSIFIPNTQPTSERLNQDIELSGYLDLVLPAIMDNNPNASAIYFGTESNLTRYYPNILLGQVVPPDFQVTQRPWYLTSIEANNGLSQPTPTWSSVYQDATGLGLVTTIAVPVRGSDGKRVGVVGLDVTLDEITKNIVAARFLKTGYTFLLDGNGSAIVMPSEGYLDFWGHGPLEGEATPKVAEAPDEIIRGIFSQILTKKTGFESLKIGDRELLLAYSTLESTGWILGSVVAASDVLQSVTALDNDLREATRSVFFRRVIPTAVIISLALLLITFLLTNKMVDPIKKLAQAAEKIGAEGHGLEITYRQPDEIGLLARTLNQMSVQIHESFEKLEDRVAERTLQLEKRTFQLETAASIASEIAAAADLKVLLQQAVDLICDRFSYYLVGIFLLDEAGEYAHLRAASGDLGKKLIQQGVRLRVGGQGMIGYVTQFGQARLANDVHKDETYLANPLLPDSRSEAVIPLLTSGRSNNMSVEPRAVIGALDIQSSAPDAFNPDDLTVLQVLADQLVVAIQNFRLVGQLQAALDELTLVHHQNTRDAWKRVISKPEGLAFEYDRTEVKSAQPLAALPEESQETNPMVVPIRQQGQVIGLICLESSDPTHAWTEDEVSILRASAEQTALTIENARLLAESKQKAVQEQLNRQIIDRIRSSLDVETVLQTALSEIAARLGIPQIEIQLDPSRLLTSASNPGNGNGHHE